MRSALPCDVDRRAMVGQNGGPLGHGHPSKPTIAPQPKLRNIFAGDRKAILEARHIVDHAKIYARAALLQILLWREQPHRSPRRTLYILTLQPSVKRPTLKYPTGHSTTQPQYRGYAAATDRAKLGASNVEIFGPRATLIDHTVQRGLELCHAGDDDLASRSTEIAIDDPGPARSRKRYGQKTADDGK